MDYEGDTIMGGMETSHPFTQQSATGLLFHLQKASTLLTNLNPQNPSAAYEEKESQVKAAIEDIYNRVVQYDMKGNQVQVQIYEPDSSDDYDYSDDDDDDDDYAEMPLQMPNLSAVQALAAARASAREGYEKRKKGHKNRHSVEKTKKRGKRRKQFERRRWEKRREKKRLARMTGLRRSGKDYAFVFENMQ